MAFVAETVVGATAGAVPAATGYFKRIREICDRHGVLLILDEVMCGMGRTGTLHACEQDGIAPDLMTIAKGLGGGYEPIGAVLLRSAHLRRLREAAAASSSTATPTWAIPWPARRPSRCRRRFGATICWPMCARRARCCADGSASASATIRMSATSAAAACSRHSSWSGTAPPRRRSIRQKLHARVKKAAMARGLMVYPMGGTIDGTQGDHVLLAPPFIVTEDQIGEIVDRLGSAVDDALAQA